MGSWKKNKKAKQPVAPKAPAKAKAPAKPRAKTTRKKAAKSE
jgi:hypothetical protein